MTETKIPQIQLNDGLHVPAIGLGTYDLRGAEGVDAMVAGLQVGYRLLDTAFNYENEGAVGEAIRRSGVPRDQVLISSKLPGRHHEYKKAIYTVEESLYRAQIDHYDLYLIHWPNPKQKLYTEAWQAMVDLQKKGLIRSIGVSNFLPEHLDTIIKATGVTPSMNQVELHPYFSQPEQRAYDASHGILTESWSPLGRASDVLNNKEIQNIATQQKKSISQVILRWHIQLGALPLPKSASKQRQIENISIFDFELSKEEMETISNLTRPTGRIANQDPAEYEEF